MPGYINQFAPLSKAEQKREAEQKLRATIHQIVHVSDFATVTADTNASLWGVDDFSVGAINIDRNEREVRVTLTYSASGTQDENRPFAGRIIEGKAVALIDDDGAVRYDDVSADLTAVQEPYSSTRVRPQNLPPGSPAWYDYWLNREWTLARTGSGARHVTVNGHELAVNENNRNPGIWRYGIELSPPGKIQWSTSEEHSELEAKRAVLKELARILLSRAV